jgi:hypothetical protein
MKVSVFGQRNIVDENLIKEKFDEVLSEYEGQVFTYIYGGAKGPQDVVYNYVKDEMDCILFQPWTMISKRLSKQAVDDNGKFDPVYFFFRNIQIVDNSDLVIIFDNGSQDAEVYKVLNLCTRKNINLVKVDV